ncbi:MAG: alpha-amylase family glycosyl hydrolase [Myxococcota bacterium]
MKRLALIAIWALGACGDGGGASDVADTLAPDSVDDADASDVADATDADTTDADATDATDADTTPSPAWYERAVMYEIFGRSFQDSDGDGIGDLPGLISRLDYLNDGVPGSGDDLEVDGLWLMPIFAASSYHGYDTTDYTTVDPHYGTNADLEALAAACEARGMHLVLDFVMNHTGDQHPWFADAESSASSAHRNWYVWRGDDPGWTQPFGSHDRVWHSGGGAFYYGIFTAAMPDLNYREPAVVAAMTDVARGWLDKGVTGFRLDAARYLVEGTSANALAEQPETHAFWKDLRAALAPGRPDLYLVGEAWTSRDAVTTYYGGGAELHQAFDFDLEGALEMTLTRGAASWLASTLAQQKQAGAPWSFEATFMSNHDLDRPTSRLPAGSLPAAATLLLTMPGTPYIYYGDELGALYAPGLGDKSKRGPMAWSADAKAGFTTGTPWLALANESATRNVASEMADPSSLLQHHRRLIALRHAHPALAGDGVKVLTAPDPGLFAMLRWSADEVVVVIVNVANASPAAVTLDLSSEAELLGDGPWTIASLLDDADSVIASDRAAIPTGGAWTPYESRILRLR